MVYPDSVIHRLKYIFWTLYAPIHPHLRDLGLRVGLIWHVPGRQKFILGDLASTCSTEELIEHLVRNGYGSNFIAWQDEGEILSLRKSPDFIYQYHIRLYSDGEIRGHYEYTPECHPYLHIREIGLVDRREYFLELLGNMILPKSEIE